MFPLWQPDPKWEKETAMNTSEEGMVISNKTDRPRINLLGKKRKQRAAI